jgi:lipopolysaccharide transport system permease protein
MKHLFIYSNISAGFINKSREKTDENNPLAYVIETARYMLLHEGSISISGLLYTTGVTLVVFFLGLIIFNRTEKSFIDTV